MSEGCMGLYYYGEKERGGGGGGGWYGEVFYLLD